jgi:uncharacterized membrane protein
VVAVTTYNWFLFFHILGAVVWLGGGMLLLVLSAIGLKSRDLERNVALMRWTTAIGGPFFGVAGLLIVGFGFALVEKGSWGYDEVFIQLGIAVWAASTLIGALYYNRAGRAVERVVAEGGVAAAAPRIRQYFLVGLLDSAMLLVALFFMTTKPFL